MPDSSLTTRQITTLEEFAACREAWNRVAGDHPFLSWEWLYSWWESFHRSGHLAIVTVLDQDGDWVAIAPWFKTTSASRGRVIRTLGSGVACSDYASVAVRPEFEDAVAEVLAEIMFGNDSRFTNVDLFEFEGHTANDPFMQSLPARIPANSASIVQEEIGGSWRTRLPDSWPAFESELKKSFRRKTKKASKRLESGEVVVEVCRTPEAVAEAWPVFVDLHQRRRQQLGQPGCFAHPMFDNFLRSATCRLAESGRAQINMIRYAGQPLTCNLEFTTSDSVWMYQTGMDPDQRKLEPGHITFCWAIQEAIRQKHRWFDFLRGDEPYKACWCAERIPLLRTRLVPRRLTSSLRYSLLAAGKQVRSLVHGVTDRAGQGDS
jgi:CelD/BcsL family acetyltransferase involved in cellulose biosynthesis